jgi:hypothetical protein
VIKRTSKFGNEGSWRAVVLWSERSSRKKNQEVGYKQQGDRPQADKAIYNPGQPSTTGYVPSFFASGDTCEFFVLRFGSRSRKLSSTYSHCVALVMDPISIKNIQGGDTKPVLCGGSSL